MTERVRTARTEAPDDRGAEVEGGAYARTPATKEPLTWRQRLSRADAKWSGYLYVAPFFVVFAIVGLFPLAYTAYVSVHDWSLLGGQSTLR